MNSQPSHRIRVWDLPTRLFHWALVGLVCGSFVTAKVGGNLMVWHSRLGYAALTLLLFRAVWGVVGSRYARFATFVRGPSAVRAYLRGDPAWVDRPGHNPLGALSVVAMLGAVGLQAATGLFATDEIAFEGPLAARVSEATSLALTTVHGLGEKAILALVALHVLAVAYYRFARGRDLIRPMLTGDASAAPGSVPARDDAATRALALVLLAFCAGAVAWLVGRGG